METATLPALASSSYATITARVSGLCATRVGSSVRPSWTAALEDSSSYRHSRASVPRSQAEQVPSCGERITRREAVVTTFAGSLASGLVLPARSGASEEVKQRNLRIEDVKKIIEDDFTSRNYLVTGDMTQSIYNENCRFQDPTTVVSGPKTYSQGLKKLFDPKGSKIQLLNIEISGPRTIDAKYRLTGFLNFPWHPYIAPYDASSRFTVGGDGLIESYDETWSISLLEAFSQFVTPSVLRKDAPKL